MENFSRTEKNSAAASFFQHKFKPFQPGILAAACGLVIALTTLPTYAQTCAPRPGGLVAWWPLDEQTGTTVVDIVGGHNGQTFDVFPALAPIGTGAAALAAIMANTWNGGPVSIPGKVGNALQFGYNIWTKVPDTPDLNFGLFVESSG